MTDVALIRFGEIFLKGENRPFFERMLLQNAQRAVGKLPGARIEKIHGRLLAFPGESGMAPMMSRLERLFGASSLSPAKVMERDVAAITAAALELTRVEVARLGRKPRFKIEARRADKRFATNSMELARVVGGAIAQELGLPVDLHTPELTIGVEVGWEKAFVYAGVLAAPGGLPVGVTGRVELLLSGGIDSPVAGWMMLKRGCTLNATYFHSFPYTGEKTQDKVMRLAKLLAGWQLSDIRLKVVPFTDAQKKLRESNPDGRMAVVLYRRMMLRITERIARASDAKALVTGEALAQVASQTLENLGVIGAAASLPVLRPCLGHDKQETIAMARKIGTFETSIEPYDDCCSLFVPDYPQTKSRLDIAEKIEASIDVKAIADDCYRRATDYVVTPY